MKRDKRQVPMLISFLISLIVLTTLWGLRESAFVEQALLWILRISYALVIIFILYSVVAQLLPKLGKFIWVPTVCHAIIIYFGFLIISLSFFEDLLSKMDWNPGMVGLGIAVVAFGWVLFTQYEQPKAKERSGESRANTAGLSQKVVALDEKFSNLENVIDTFLEESEKLAKRLTALQEGEKSKDNQAS